MNIAIGTDHRGFEQKEFIKNYFDGSTTVLIDMGAYDAQRSDYPLFAERVCTAMLNGQAHKGILLCASGIGMAIAANRYKKIYAAVAWNEAVAKSSAQEDYANVLVIPSDYVTQEQAVRMIEVWLNAAFLGGRYAERIAMIDGLKT